jgi:hypothetical protein
VNANGHEGPSNGRPVARITADVVNPDKGKADLEKEHCRAHVPGDDELEPRQRQQFP